jgi:hypothetical protein
MNSPALDARVILLQQLCDLLSQEPGTEGALLESGYASVKAICNQLTTHLTACSETNNQEEFIAMAQACNSCIATAATSGEWLPIYPELRQMIRTLYSSISNLGSNTSDGTVAALLDVDCKLTLEIDDNELPLSPDTHFKLIDNLRSELRSEHALLIGAMTFYLAVTAIIGNTLSRASDITFTIVSKIALIFWLIAGVLALYTTAQVINSYDERHAISKLLLDLSLSKHPLYIKGLTKKIAKSLSDYSINVGKIRKYAICGLISSAMTVMLIVGEVAVFSVYRIHERGKPSTDNTLRNDAGTPPGKKK